MTHASSRETTPGPYVELSRDDWAALASDHRTTIDQETLDRLRGRGEPTSMEDVVEVYHPLCQLLELYRDHTGRLWDASNHFLHQEARRTPFVIGIAGSVAVGKSTTARLVQALLASLPSHPRVDLVTTDGFLYPNAELERRGILGRKGFPESYDRRALLGFVMAVKSGAPRVTAPVYDHGIYDIVPGGEIIVESPDILVIEGLNVLQPARVRADGTAGLAVSDFFDFSVYVDAAEEDIQRWYLDRFMDLRRTAFRDPHNYFARYAHMTDLEASVFASQVWEEINGPNLLQNIAPTRGRATAILRKGPDHRIAGVRIRKI